MTPQNNLEALTLAPMAEVDLLLDSIRAETLAGDWQSLSAKAPALEALLPALAALRGAPATRAALAPLQKKALHTSECLAAAARGVRAARHRLEEIRQAQTSLATYDDHGRRAEVKTAAPQLLQRF